VIFLLSTIGICLILFGGAPIDPSAGVFPGNAEIVENYDEHIDSRVVISGPVVTVAPLTIEVSAETGETVTLRVSGVERGPAVGDVLSVYGTLQPDRRIESVETVRKPAENYWRTRALSLFAGLWVLWRGRKHWRPNVRAVLIEQRDTSLSSADSEDTDA